MLRGAKSGSRWTVVSTSRCGRWCLAGLVVAYLALAVLAGVPRSPITVPLPAGATPPAWAGRFADLLGLAHIGRPAVTATSVLVMAAALVAFGLLLKESLAGRVAVGAVLATTGVSVLIAVTSPLLLSRDAISYVAYGRLVALHHANPYATLLSSFPTDSFVRVTSRQWVKIESPYGPAVMLLGAGVARAWASAPGAAIAAFKVLAGLGVACAAVCTCLAAKALRPERAALAAAIVGLNPVLILHTVGGGHIDGVLAGLLAGALALAVTTPFPNAISNWGSMTGGPANSDQEAASAGRVVGRWVGVTLLLSLAVFMRLALLPALLVWLWWVVRALSPGRRLRLGVLLIGIVAGVGLILFLPFLGEWRSSPVPLLLGGVEYWASPVHLVATAFESAVRGLVGAGTASVASSAVTFGFLIVFIVIAILVGREYGRVPGTSSLPDWWGSTILLLALAWPYLLPWYSAWFLPYLGLMTDDVLMWIGVGVAAALSLTLIPADPPNGLTAWGVMDTAHYVVAPILLTAFVLVAVRIARTGDARRALGAQPLPPAGPRAGSEAAAQGAVSPRRSPC